MLWAAILDKLKTFAGWVVSFLLGVLLFVMAVRNARKNGAIDEQIKRTMQEAKDREFLAVRKANEAKVASQKETETVQAANNVKAENSKLDDGAVIIKLRDRFTRD